MIDAFLTQSPLTQLKGPELGDVHLSRYPALKYFAYNRGLV